MTTPAYYKPIATRAEIVFIVLALIVLPALGFAWGRTAAERRLGAELEAKSRQSTELRDSLWIALNTVRADTVRVDSIVTRWRTVKESLPVDTVTDTVTLRELVRVADTVIVEVDAARRQCIAVLSTCQAAVEAEKKRGDIALVLYDQQRRAASRWRTVERVACAVGVTSALTWGATR